VRNFAKFRPQEQEGIFFHKCPFSIITNYVLEKKAFQGNFHHTPFRLGAVILPVLSYSLYNLLHQLTVNKILDDCD
jgi:hypothetical protein